jgi:RimJ/RimL family protein N-acetyltransferase
MTLLASDQTIETERLLLRRITRDDFPFYARIHALPEVARYLAHGRPRSVEETVHWLDAILDSYRDLQLGQIAIVRKSDGALIGRCGVSHLETEIEPLPDGSYRGHYFPSHAPADREHVVQPELGYTLDSAHWGKGYAREAVAATRSYLLSRRPNLDVVSLIHPENARSIHLASTLGATRIDRVMYLDRGFDRYAWPSASRSQLRG